MATLFRMQVVLKHRTGVARDAASNNFWIYDADAAPPAVEPLAEEVRDFYTRTSAGGWGLPNNLGFQIHEDGHEVRAYRYDVATGARLPYDGAPPDHVEVFSLLGRVSVTYDEVLPSEVAMCLSYANVGSGSEPARRRRGRIYLGPLGNNSVDIDSATGRMRPVAIFRTEMMNHANVLADNLRTLLGADAGWVVYSRPYEGRDEIVRPGRTTLPALPARVGQVHLVNQVSIDDALDTMRSRGERPTTRNTLTV